MSLGARMTLQLRLTLLVSGLLLSILLVAAAWIVLDARSAVEEEVEASLEIATGVVELMIAPGGTLTGDGGTRVTRHLVIQRFDSVDVPKSLPPAPLAQHQFAPEWFRDLVEPASRTVTMAAGTPDRPGPILLTTDPAEETAESWAEARRLLLVLLGFFLLGGGLVLLLIRQALKPIGALTLAVERVEQGDFSARVEGASSLELDRVIERFNHMARTLQTTREHNETLTGRALTIREAERRALAQELHDQMGQSITAIRAMAAAIATKPDEKADAERAKTISAIAEDMHKSVRGMMHKLRPAVLDELGLKRAIEVMVDDWNTHHAEGFCRLSCEGTMPAVPEGIGINLYRIVQEALTNVARHAPSATVSVQLAVHEARRLMLTIEDDGPGFEASRRSEGLGLSGMRERAEAMGGRLDVVTEPGRGVRLSLEVLLA